MLKTNKEKVIIMGAQGTVASAKSRDRHHVDASGNPFLVPGVGGISYNVKVGHPAFGWAGDHFEPCVSTILDEAKRFDPPNAGYHFFSCVGNEARIISGDAKGDKGIVTGYHGGREHVMMDFSDETLEKLTFDDKILVRGYGQGLRLLDYPDIHLYNLDPKLLEQLGVVERKKHIEVPVAAVVPGELMGSGIGQVTMGQGDYDIMTTDKKLIKKLGLHKLRLGDFVCIQNHDNVYGSSYREGAVTIGIIVHGDANLAGHGPGVTTLITSAKPIIKPVMEKKANIADILKIGIKRGK